MSQIYSLTLILVAFFSFGQQKKEDKNVIVTQKFVGSWKLDYALYTTSFMGTVFKDKNKIFHTDTIHFFNYRTFRFNTHSDANTDIQTHTGNWEITNKGKVLVHKNRQALPPFEVPSPDLTFPIKIINANRIRIDYTVYFVQDESTHKANNTPVFFDRIK